MPEFEFLKVGTSTWVRLSEWKGAISIETGYEDKAGNVVLEWILAEHYDKAAGKKVPNDKNTPLKIYLGSKERAIEVLEALVDQLKGQDSNIPF